MLSSDPYARRHSVWEGLGSQTTQPVEPLQRRLRGAQSKRGFVP
jgi:hypothetical protein